MAQLALSILVFVVAHGLPSTPLRPWFIEHFGRRAFMVAFSALSVALFAWVWLSYRHAEIENVFWVTGPVGRSIGAVVMLAAILLLVLAVTGKPRLFLTGETVLSSPESVRGVLRITRHPLLWAITFWGLVHMANNADPPSWLFFGFLTLLALGGTWAIDRRRARLLEDGWPAIEAVTSNLPFLAIMQGRNRLVFSEIGWTRLAIGSGLWALILTLHEPVFGVSPLWF